MIERKSIEVFSEASNSAIVRMPGRKFPGVVIQGDSLYLLASAAKHLHKHVDPDGPLKEWADELSRLLSGHLAHYEAVLADNGMELPYFRLPAR